MSKSRMLRNIVLFVLVVLVAPLPLLFVVYVYGPGWVDFWIGLRAPDQVNKVALALNYVALSLYGFYIAWWIVFLYRRATGKTKAPSSEVSWRQPRR